jgi:lipopolysaccharide export system permease protein
VKTLRLMLLKSFLPIFVIASLFFVLLLELIDLFANISRYASNAVSLAQMGTIALLYVPKCLSYALPVAFLFSISFTLGMLYTHNELVAVFGSGIGLVRFIQPFLVLGILFSVGGFFLEDRVVIDTFRRKNAAYAAAVKSVSTDSQPNVTVISADRRTVYQAVYYNDAEKKLSSLLIVDRDAAGVLERRLDAAWAEWKENRWVLHDCRVYRWDKETGILTDQRIGVVDEPRWAEPPFTFRKLTKNVDEMNRSEAAQYVATLRRAGVPSAGAQTDYYRKFSFACTPLVVAMIAASLGGAFKKNVLLMSLLTALAISVLYYVFQMVTALMAKNGLIFTPLLGAWLPFLFFLLVGAFLFRMART